MRPAFGSSCWNAPPPSKLKLAVAQAVLQKSSKGELSENHHLPHRPRDAGGQSGSPRLGFSNPRIRWSDLLLRNHGFLSSAGHPLPHDAPLLKNFRTSIGTVVPLGMRRCLCYFLGPLRDATKSDLAWGGVSVKGGLGAKRVCLLRGGGAVDEVLPAGDEGGSIREQKAHEGRDLFGFAEAPHGMGSRELEQRFCRNIF